MCGRFSFSQSPEAIANLFAVTNVGSIEPKYNIAPSQPIPTIFLSPTSSQREFRFLRWGLIPSWAKDRKMGAKLINARSETVMEKPSFKSAFRHRRCLILSDGFYEWQRQGTKKQPFHFKMQDSQPFAFAGLWERWQSRAGDTRAGDTRVDETGAGEIIETCTIITVEANELVRPIHHRMPAILRPEDCDRWLAKTANTAELLPLLRPYDSGAMTATPASGKRLAASD